MHLVCLSSVPNNNLSPKRSFRPRLGPLCCQLKPELVPLTWRASAGLCPVRCTLPTWYPSPSFPRAEPVPPVSGVKGPPWSWPSGHSSPAWLFLGLQGPQVRAGPQPSSRPGVQWPLGSPQVLQAHLQFPILLLEVLILIRVTLRKLVHVDPKLVNLLPDLQPVRAVRGGAGGLSPPQAPRGAPQPRRLTRSFSLRISPGTRQSALAMRGTMFTFSCRAFMKPTSTGRSL